MEYEGTMQPTSKDRAKWLLDMLENAPLVVDTTNALDVDLDDAEILAEMRQANPVAAKYNNWPIKKETE